MSRNKISLFLIALLAVDLSADEISFRKQIAPVLLANCYGCHNAKTSEGSYRVDSFNALLRAGDSVEIPVASSDPDASELLRRLVTDDADERMPAESEALAKQDIAMVRKWIEQGATYDAENPDAPLASILPVAQHPLPPETYRFSVPITAVAMRGDNLFVGGYHEILHWDWKQQKLVARIPQTGQRVKSIQLADDQGRMFVGSGTPGRLGEVRVFDLQTSQLIGVPLTTSEVVLSIRISPDGRRFAAASADTTVRIIDVQTSQVLHTIDSHSDWVNAVNWSHDGTLLATASRDKTAKVFDTTTWRLTANHTGHAENVVDVCFAFGKVDRLLSCDITGKLQRWQTKGGKKKDFPRQGNEAYRLQSMAAGIWVSSNSSSGATLNQLGWNEGKLLHRLGAEAEPVLAIAVDAETNRMATGNFSGTVRVWDLANYQLLSEFNAFPLGKVIPARRESE